MDKTLAVVNQAVRQRKGEGIILLRTASFVEIARPFGLVQFLNANRPIDRNTAAKCGSVSGYWCQVNKRVPAPKEP